MKDLSELIRKEQVMSVKEYRDNITQMLGCIEDKKVLKLIYEIVRRFFVDRVPIEG